ncbi:DUF58 domain-containing protein [Pontibacter ramchanderi]|uniref:VWA domain-containing protein n=1 Tax=Pontibacter ramchanderi TaxID=1179743 RepID=A0A2N3V0W8_9BACT|nr:hypothetical protein [Pontibacter ramchanderi]PKV75268.1 hypothetical protein BD749_0206 [Pontibacter ramchanderi]
MDALEKKQHLKTVLQHWKDSWQEAKRVWSPFVKLREPVWCATTRTAHREGLTGSFAMIRLSDHRIVIDLEKVLEEGVADYPVEILAHEIGHHIYTPANLHENAVLLSRIRWCLADIEDRAPFVANLYADLLINDTLQRKKGLQMAAVYQQINQQGESNSKVWQFYMRTFEYLWKLERGALGAKLSKQHPMIDADASLAASLIRSYAKNWLEGAGRFAALLYPYLMEDKEYEEARKVFVLYLDAEYAGLGGGMITGLVEIDEEGLASIIDPRVEAAKGKEGSEAAGVFGKVEAGGEGPRQRYLNPGRYIDLFKQINPNANEQELINNYYREIALPHLVSFPLETVNPVSLSLPEGTESWDISDPMEEIDWIETAVHSPQIFPGYNTMKRIYGSDTDDSETKRPLDVYIGIDCSGSMGNPRQRFSWPVLAATVIGLSALRAGAKVMGCLSGEPGSFMETDGFRESDVEVLTVLTSYLGTGYAYGVPRLETPFGQPAQNRSHVVIVTDDDIFRMLGAVSETTGISNWVTMEKALMNAGGVGTLVLHSAPEWHREEVVRLQKMGWHVYYVTNEEQLLSFAAEFSQNHYSVRSHD